MLQHFNDLLAASPLVLESGPRHACVGRRNKEMEVGALIINDDVLLSRPNLFMPMKEPCRYTRTRARPGRLAAASEL